MSQKVIYGIAMFLVVTDCQSPKIPTLFESIAPDRTGIHFSNDLREDENLNILTYEYFYNGGGVGVGDINNDGLQDVFMTGNMTDSRLYLNKGDLHFEDITEFAGIKIPGGWARGIAMADINGDGYQDIYVSRSGPDVKSAGRTPRPNLLFMNQGNNTFLEMGRDYGLNFDGNTTQAAFFDYDRDGDLDAYLLTNVMERKGPNVIRAKQVDGSALSTDKLYRNNGNQTFTDVSKEANILIEGFGLGISIVDINDDGWPDVYVSNDYLSNDLLYINQGNGTFKNEIKDYFRHQSYSAMGNDAADIDNDGLVDFITVDMLPEGNERRKNMFGLMNYDRHLSELKMGYEPEYMRNTLQHNNGKRPGGNSPMGNHPFFSEIGRFSGVQATDWSWSALLADYDNDGLRDLMITNGYPKDITNRDFVIYRMAQYQQEAQSGKPSTQSILDALKNIEGAHVPNYLFKNKGGLTFRNESKSWGFDTPSFSNGAAYADLDNDGDLDFIINNINGPASVYQNHSDKQKDSHYLRIRLNGTKENPFGFGAKVYLYSNHSLQFIEHSPYRGYQSTVENTLHFGLGKTDKIDSVRIVWPDQRTQSFYGVNADQRLLVDHKKASKFENNQRQAAPPALFLENSDPALLQYKHTDELYIDFKIQPLLPHLLSQNGPGVAVGDINGDKLEDFFVGGAFRHSGSFFIQTKNQKFTERPLTSGQKFEEDMGSLLFDCDEDGDLDLYVVSGSSEFQKNSKYYQDRLYKNDGKGKFSQDPYALPVMNTSGSSVSAADFDQDGDLDLFVGGRLVPGEYPLPARSRILRNDRGKFTDVTPMICPELQSAGMVTAALWTDFDQDGWVDLIITGEWMPITFLKNRNGKFSNVTKSTGLSNTHGWWNSLVSGDFDEDGDLDYVAGNVGLNTEDQPSADKPLTLFYKDFDGNGTIDPVMGRYFGANLYPIHPRDEMTSQMNFLKKRFVYYKDYATAQMKDIFSKEELKNTLVMKCQEMRTMVIENLGRGKFRLSPLPTEAQLGPVYGLCARDYDLDGHVDLLLTGNSYAPESISGRLDAFNGLYLKGNGKGKFEPQKAGESGFLVEGDAKGLADVALPNGSRLILAAQNNDLLKTFLIPKPKSKYLEIKPSANDSWADIQYKNGIGKRHEWHYGSGYLSQSSRTLRLPSDKLKLVTIHNFRGQARSVPLIAK